MRKITVTLMLLSTLAVAVFGENEGIHVYDPVPGLDPSEFYSFRVRTVGSSTWLDPFAFITRCQQGGETNHYYKQIEDWSNTYINFEMSNGVPVEIEISKVGGAPITNAVAHPVHKVDSCEVIGGKAYVVLEDPALFTVDIDGQMDDQNTARINPTGWDPSDFYSGPPIHTLTVFANPFLQDKPATNDPNVYLVEPGVVPPSTGSWDALYFLPGVHDIGRTFPVHANKNYYIPGDAIVHGTFFQDTWADGHDIRIFGHGTLSGERIPHPTDDTPSIPEGDPLAGQYHPIHIPGAYNTTVEGITIADSPYHSLMLYGVYAPATPTDTRWVKIFTWRANGDGINPFGNGLIEDCFIRTADDCSYVNGRGIRRCVFWTDVNGSVYTMTPIGTISNPDLVVEDCDILYNRSIFQLNSAGGGVFNMRGLGSGAGGSNVTFRDIRVSDPRPTRSCFGIDNTSSWTQDPSYAYARGPGDITGILFRDIAIAAPSILGYPETLWGEAGTEIHDLIFDNVTMSGEPFDHIDEFNHNAYVHDLIFIAPPYISYTPAYLEENFANDGSVEGEIVIDLLRDNFTADVVSGGHVTAGNVPAGLVPVYTRLGDTQLSLTFTGSARNHLAADSISDLTVAFADDAFVTNTASSVIGATNSALGIVFYDSIPFAIFRDSFEDGGLATATSPGDINGGFDVYKVNDTDAGIQAYETAGNGVLDLTGSITPFPHVAMVSKNTFDAGGEDNLVVSVEVAGLTESYWYLRPFTVNLRPNASVNAQTYQPGVIAPPQGLSLMVGNGQYNCRVALVAYDGVTENWLWEDLSVTHAELADGFDVTLTVNRTNGWQLAFTGAASLPADVSGSWGSLGWDDIFNHTTYVQCYIREDGLSGAKLGKAKAEIGSITVTRSPADMLYINWAAGWPVADLSDPGGDNDLDGLSNFGEYALNGNPTDAADRGLMDIHTDSSWFTFVYASNVVDNSIRYTLTSRTNLTSGIAATNSWDAQTIGPVVGDYAVISNYFSTIDENNMFLQLNIEREDQ